MTTAPAIDRDAIADRNERLEAARAHLQGFFVGIDEIIDELIDGMRVWYLMPEVLTRPVIINLWGMTGVGKTDLVRRLVKFLDVQERFAEVELSNNDTTQWHSSVADVLERNELNDGKPSIVLFDEIQRFNTIDQEGKPVPATKFTDFWELLSDGRLAKRERGNLDLYVANYMLRQQANKRRRDKGEEVEDETLGVWEAQELRKYLRTDQDTFELASSKEVDLLPMLMDAKRSKRVYEPIDHSKTLIIISGNLDEAFNFARMTDEADVDADIFHAFTKKITVVDVKGALTKRFKPEQVARFGNIHLIYPSLRRQDFEELIRREIDRICANAHDHMGVTVVVDEAIHRLVYRNGVFPTQGTRPVFSSVADILETNLSRFLFEAVMAEVDRVEVGYDEARQMIVARVGERFVERPCVGRLDKIRQNRLADFIANVSVHESGHAVAYAVLFGLAPLQLTSKVTSSYAGGFTFPHQIHETRGNLLKKVQVFLAGGLAEEVVFGDDDASIGRESDRETATQMVLDYTRKYGFDESWQATYTMDFAYKMDGSVTEPDAEKLISRLVGETRRLLSEHRPLLLAMSLRLREEGKLDAADVSKLCSAHGVEAVVEAEGHQYVTGYADRLSDLAGE